MAECPDKYKKLVPLSKVVNSAILDSYEDIGKTKELYSHWAARGYKKLNNETLKGNKRSVKLMISQNTKTAALPPDFDREVSVYFVENGKKVLIYPNSNIVNDESIYELECEETCPKCNQDKAICESLTVTESVENIIVDGGQYEKTTIKKLYPNGDYYLEVTQPYLNVETSNVEFATVKKFITSISLKDCGCIEESEENLCKLKDCCHDTWSCYYGCHNGCERYSGGYRVFDEVGQMQFDFSMDRKFVYMDYYGYIQKINGQYAVPEVSFETLVEYVKFKSVCNKKSVQLSERNWYLQNYRRERGNMEKILGRISLSFIIAAINKTPVFNFDNGYSCSRICNGESVPVVQIDNTNCSNTSVYCNTTVNPPSGQVLTPFQLAVLVPTVLTDGLPQPMGSIWQSDIMKGALNLEYIIVDEINYSRKLGKFTFDSATGTIDMSPNVFYPYDGISGCVIVNFNKLV